jgi:uracil-DNA glycosylase
MKLLTWREREKLRESFRPKRIRIMFIGEAPPASGRFFYSANSGLYRAMRDAFRAVEPQINDENFISFFRASGCYLIDLCPMPVDQLDAKSRRRARVAGEQLLSEKLIRLRPEKIALVLRAIANHVVKAAKRANWRGEIIELPYPGRWHRHRVEFLEALEAKLPGLFIGTTWRAK